MKTRDIYVNTLGFSEKELDQMRLDLHRKYEGKLDFAVYTTYVLCQKILKLETEIKELKGKLNEKT